MNKAWKDCPSCGGEGKLDCERCEHRGGCKSTPCPTCIAHYAGVSEALMELAQEVRLTVSAVTRLGAQVDQKTLNTVATWLTIKAEQLQ